MDQNQMDQDQMQLDQMDQDDDAGVRALIGDVWRRVSIPISRLGSRGVTKGGVTHWQP